MRKRPIAPATGLALCLMLACWAAAQPSHARSPAQRDISIPAIAIAFDPANPARERFGRLTFRGGLQFGDDPKKRFGGFSGIALNANGERFAIAADNGNWISGTLTYLHGRVVGAQDLLMARLRDGKGNPLKGKSDQDAESIAPADGLYLDKRVLVSFERNHRIAAYSLGKDGDFGPSRVLDLPAAVSGLALNQGLEAIGLFPQGTPLAGTIIAIAERKLDDARNHTGWLIKEGKARPLTIARSDAFEITDLAILPDGGVIILERRYAPFFGMAMRLRMVSDDEIAAGGIIRGEILLEADERYNVDNMEGLAIHRDADGGVVLTIISDNNFSKSQRSLLLQFRLD